MGSIELLAGRFGETIVGTGAGLLKKRLFEWLQLLRTAASEGIFESSDLCLRKFFWDL